MKRSEMIDILADSIEKHENSFNMYTLVLKDLEQAGMLPPTVFLETFGRSDNVWEKEDGSEAQNTPSEASEPSDEGIMSDLVYKKAEKAFKDAVKAKEDGDDD